MRLIIVIAIDNEAVGDAKQATEDAHEVFGDHEAVGDGLEL